MTDTLPSPAGEPEMPEPVATVDRMPGATGFGIAVFKNSETPLTTPIYTADQLRTYGDARAEHARRVALVEAAAEVESWRGGKLLLAAGEMSAQELRTVRAVTAAIGRAIRALARKEGAT